MQVAAGTRLTHTGEPLPRAAFCIQTWGMQEAPVTAKDSQLLPIVTPCSYSSKGQRPAQGSTVNTSFDHVLVQLLTWAKVSHHPLRPSVAPASQTRSRVPGASQAFTSCFHFTDQGVQALLQDTREADRWAVLLGSPKEVPTPLTCRIPGKPAKIWMLLPGLPWCEHLPGR